MHEDLQLIDANYRNYILFLYTSAYKNLQCKNDCPKLFIFTVLYLVNDETILLHTFTIKQLNINQKQLWLLQWYIFHHIITYHLTFNLLRIQGFDYMLYMQFHFHDLSLIFRNVLLVIYCIMYIAFLIILQFTNLFNNLFFSFFYWFTILLFLHNTAKQQDSRLYIRCNFQILDISYLANIQLY